MGRITSRRRVTRIRRGIAPTARADVLAVEEPLEIRIGGDRFAVTMRTPGNDVELTIGFLVSEGIVTTAESVMTARYCAGTDDDGANTYNVLDITLAPGVAVPATLRARDLPITSACGVCGKDSIESVTTRSAFDVGALMTPIDAELLLALPARLRDEQKVFDKTGGLHAAGLFDATTGALLAVREDVGRHNAVDKVVGWATAQQRLPLHDTVLQVSGRASFELVQKAAMAGIPVLSAVSAPSSLAAELADERHITLIGFSRGDSMVVYTHADRVDATQARLSARSS
ncbi:formate dehydrogenase accessory sulfurtransferase FdhD [Gordonia sp. ABSL11-1]|uniref:formate dehydrogenase accessory sulfurtransferase FdhD n=1 Tax=Gordonia sp. ABSL11-1 TaxID=3053924 RepID=UPI0025733F13|nr:formate dehydrogenase accessory sulfurtransferase FdhD [Gordonia sp. ABSL11-1]MDL9944953.1 formate dehydrogenase accessory sulfurtransferase FdhD [Gordonia sp. ABSL11-1]